MDEREKMLRGSLYNPNDAVLNDLRIQCKVLCQKYNLFPVDDFNGRKALMKQILGKTGESFHIEQSFWCDYGANIEIGENFYSNHNLVILDPAQVTFGDNVFIGPNCAFYTALHPFDTKTRNQGLEYAKPVKVGNNVWFGGNVTVLPGVTIGDNAVIGAGSVVTRDIPSGMLSYGNPCKVIRKIDG